VEPENPIVFEDEQPAPSAGSPRGRWRWQWVLVGVGSAGALIAGIVVSAGGDPTPRSLPSPTAPLPTVLVTESPRPESSNPQAPTTPATPVDHNFTTEAPPGVTPSILVGTSWVLRSTTAEDGTVTPQTGQPIKLVISTTGDVAVGDGCHTLGGSIDITAVGKVHGVPARQIAGYPAGGNLVPISPECEPLGLVEAVLFGSAPGSAEVATAIVHNGTLTLYRPGAGRLVYAAGTAGGG
jgi:hypothetical protein